MKIGLAGTPVWQSGDITLICGDCLEVMKGILDGSVDAVVTDPPYGVAMIRGDSKVQAAIAGDNATPDIAWIAEYPAIIWGGNMFCHQLPISTGWLVWYKHFPDCAQHSQAELAWTNTVKTVRHHAEAYHGFMRQRDGWFHPTQKPPALMRWCIAMCSAPGDTILDPFMGSGTTGVACVQTGRNFIGIEISEEYFKIAEQRIAEAQLQPRLFTEAVTPRVSQEELI